MKACPFLLLCAIITFEACSKSDSTNNATSNALNSGISQQVPNLKVDSAISSFMRKYNIPGAALAISRNGKMVYLKGYGFADATSKTSVTGSSLFRITGLSKTFTAVAIMKLVEDKRLTLDTKVFGADGVLGTTYGTQPYNTNLQGITVRDLMQETTGWPADGEDPMYVHSDYNASQLVSWTLDNRPLTVAPGTTYLSSNFTYFLLGRIIEKITNVSYKDYVKVKVLEPCGIGDMQIAGNTKKDRKQNEVTYYGYSDEDPYGFNIARMDADAGWLANAQDILKFLVSTDGFTSKADLLTSASLQAITMPPAGSNYASGWFVNGDNWTNIGNLPGSSSEIVRTGGGFCWTILCNSRSTDANYLTDLDNIIWSVVNNKDTQWPAANIDLF
ncbi:serine hydrolase domain-containing protein [Pinibacter aurantiacus]|uniref:Beta-lactamase family protein n=1 Tax=Pinibacter aurantiacus TaxID=2851599 RepID=A0A9E2W535_9BACT|nr:serine hydrolase domain-containing protein [Pinibacter aurantiacus]MBV4358489.1 beta-lactamase family protein [Pinibacter aurantiacus]